MTVARTPLAGRVLAAVRYNTGGPQPEAIDAAHVKTLVCSSGGAPPERVEAVLTTLVTQEDLVEVDGRYRIPAPNGEGR